MISVIISMLIKGVIIAAVFSVLIIIHELGHFLAARLFGVRVTDFSIGFGPAIFKKKIKKTNFLICWIPLGGYIKMAGDSRAESRGYKDEFFSKSPGIRSGIVLGGPLFNYILAFIIFVIITTIGFPVHKTVVDVVQHNSPAQEAGIQKGDKIVTINGQEVEYWFQVRDNIQQAEEPVEIEIKRRGETINLDVSPKKETFTNVLNKEVEIFQIGIMPYGPIVGSVLEGYPAKKAGIKKGDKILEINGEPINDWVQISENIQNVKRSVKLKIKRDKEIFSLEVPVKKEKPKTLSAKKQKISVIGIKPPQGTEILKTSFPSSLVKGANMLYRTTILTVKSLWCMVTDPSISIREHIGGPLAIGYMISKTATEEIVVLLRLMASLSIILFIINLLPFPVLDGGHILLFLIEKIKRKPVSQKIEDTANQIGFFLLITLVIFVFYNDIVRHGSNILKDLKSSFSQEKTNESGSIKKLENND